MGDPQADDHPISTPFDVVVVGASAGGLRALQVVLRPLPETFPVPIAIVQHLDPRHRSLMAEILDRHTDLPVKQAAEGERLRAGTVYVAPPDRHLLLGPSGVVRMADTELVHFVRPSIDLLFESAAGTFRGRALAVILTGTGSDGASGVEAVHEVGGTVIVEDDETAEFSPMPHAAIATGCADFVLPLDEIGPALTTLVMPEEQP